MYAQSRRNRVSRGARVSVSHLRTGTSLPRTPTADKHSKATIRMFLPELQDLIGICYKQEVMDFCRRRNQYPQFSTPHHTEVCRSSSKSGSLAIWFASYLFQELIEVALQIFCKKRHGISFPRGQILTGFCRVFGVSRYAGSLNLPASSLLFAFVWDCTFIDTAQ